MKFLEEIVQILLILGGTVSVLFLGLLISMHREHKRNAKKKEK
jgi:hypothetical protein